MLAILLRRPAPSQPSRLSVLVLSLLTPLAFFGPPQSTLAATDSSRIEGIRSLGLAEPLRSGRSAFPKDGPKLDTKQGLEKLEALSPGWESWSVRVEAGEVETVKLRPANRP